MTGGQLAATYGGVVNENLAMTFLSKIAFTTKVQRQDDLGHDYHCVLHVPIVAPAKSGTGTVALLTAGPPFNVQAKSDRDSLRYEQSHEREWIGTQQSPFFVCVVDEGSLTVEFFSTWNLHNAIQAHGYGKPGDARVDVVELTMPKPGADAEWPGFTRAGIEPPDDGNGFLLSVPLGPPILSATLPEVIADPDAFRAVLRQWIDFERANIVRQAMRMHWVYGPDAWRTNQPFSSSTPVCGGFYVNPRNLYREADHLYRETLPENLLRNAVAVFAAVSEHRKQLPGVALPGVTAELEAAVDELLMKGDHLLDGVARGVLARHRGQEPTPPIQPEPK